MGGASKDDDPDSTCLRYSEIHSNILQVIVSFMESEIWVVEISSDEDEKLDPSTCFSRRAAISANSDGAAGVENVRKEQIRVAAISDGRCTQKKETSELDTQIKRDGGNSSHGASQFAVDDSDDVVITGEVGPVACRDYPHPRHLCWHYPFKQASHSIHCLQCHCYVCDERAPCLMWGSGDDINDHCNADASEKWTTLRKFKRCKPAAMAANTSLSKLHSPSSFTESGVVLPAASKGKGCTTQRWKFTPMRLAVIQTSEAPPQRHCTQVEFPLQHQGLPNTSFQAAMVSASARACAASTTVPVVSASKGSHPPAGNGQFLSSLHVLQQQHSPELQQQHPMVQQQRQRPVVFQHPLVQQHQHQVLQQQPHVLQQRPPVVQPALPCVLQQQRMVRRPLVVQQQPLVLQPQPPVVQQQPPVVQQQQRPMVQQECLVVQQQPLVVQQQRLVLLQPTSVRAITPRTIASISGRIKCPSFQPLPKDLISQFLWKTQNPSGDKPSQSQIGRAPSNMSEKYGFEVTSICFPQEIIPQGRSLETNAPLLNSTNPIENIEWIMEDATIRDTGLADGQSSPTLDLLAKWEADSYGLDDFNIALEKF